MNILLLGGTGAMGMHLAKELANAEHSVFVTTRSNRTDSNSIRYLVGNSHEVNFLNTVLKQKHWDAIVDFMSYQTAEFQNKYMFFLNSTKQYIFLSSSRVYASSKEKLTENSPRLLDVCADQDYISTDEYALAKARQENLLKQSGKKNWTIIRPYVTFSESRLQLSCEEKESWLYRAIHRRTIVFSKDLSHRKTTFTYGADVAKGIASIIGKDGALGEAFHITQNESYLWSDLLKIYLDALEIELGYRPKVLEKEKYEPYMGGNLPQVKYDRLYDRVFDNRKINTFIDTAKFNKTRDAVHLCIHEFMKKPMWLNINWGAEALKDRHTKEFISFNEWLNISGIKNKLKYLVIRLGLFTPKSLKIK